VIVEKLLEELKKIFEKAEKLSGFLLPVPRRSWTPNTERKLRNKLSRNLFSASCVPYDDNLIQELYFKTAAKFNFSFLNMLFLHDIVT